MWLLLGAAGTVGLAIDQGPGTSENNIGNGLSQEGYEATKEQAATAITVGEFSMGAGTVSLDKAPNLHFVNAAGKDPSIGDVTSGVTLQLDKNTSSLTVSDFRTAASTGWKVYAAISPFQKDAKTALTGTTLTLKAVLGSRPDDGINVAAPAAVTIPATGEAGLVINADPKTGTLVNNFVFDQQTTVNIAPQAAQSGHYQSQLTWTLANVPTVHE